VDPSKVKLPKELRKIKSKVAKDTKSLSFAKQMKRLKSPKKENPMTISAGELLTSNKGPSLNVSPTNKLTKVIDNRRDNQMNNSNGMYTS
jgi:hypothetical protein